MVRDSRWPIWPMLILRGFQIFFGIILLGCSAYVVSIYALWYAALGVVTSLFTLIYVGVSFFLLFANLMLPLAVVIVDAFLLIFWLITMAGYGSSGLLSYSCDINLYDSWTGYYIGSGTSVGCEVIKASFGISFIIFLLFIGSLVIAAIVLHRNRHDLNGAQHNAGTTSGGELQNMEAGGAVPGQVQQPGGEVYGVEQKQEFQQPIDSQYQQYPQPGADGYYHQQEVPIVSPPQTPAPYHQAQVTGGYPSPPPPPPPPVATQEMPTYHQHQ